MRIKYLLSSILGGAAGVAIVGFITYEFRYAKPDPVFRTWSEIECSDTLRVVTIPSTFSAFAYKDGWKGHEYEVASQVCRELGLTLQLLFAPSEQAMFDSLQYGAADVAAWPTFFSVAREREHLLSCGYIYELGLIPVCRQEVDLQTTEPERYSLAVIEGGRDALALQDQYVLEYFDRSPFHVVQLETDSVNPETLTEQVANGDYDAALLPTNMAQLLRTYYPDLKVGHPLIESEDSVGWVVCEGADTLAAKIDSVCSFVRTVPHFAPLTKRYFEQSLGRSVKIRYLLGNGRLSVYDPLFRKYAKYLNWDWRMLAAVAFVESRFDPHEISRKGARGLMQLMPSTAMRFGCPGGLITDPEANVQAGAKLIKSMENGLKSRLSRTMQPGVESFEKADTAVQHAIERDLIRFTLASYNAGMGHVFDAIALADTLGYSPAVWEENVAHCFMLKTDSAYYNLPCVKQGRFNARVTIDYVNEVLETYDDFCRQVRE